MKRFLLMVLSGLLFSGLGLANSTAHDLSSGNFSQNWTNVNLISVDDNWSSVPSIEGFRGDTLAGTGVDPQTILTADDAGVADVIANQSNPDGLATGGVAEFDGIVNPVVAFQGSGTADAPYLRIYLNTTGRQNIQVSYNLRDIDGANVDAIQPVALHYRLGNSGTWTNVAAAYVADASTGPNVATLVTPVSVTLPAAVENQALVQVRIMTSNAAGSDEFIGVDDLLISSSSSVAPLVASAVVDNNVSVVGGADGAATASATGGTPGYLYAWSNGATTASITGLVTGVYTVTVTDSLTVTDTASVTITEPAFIVNTSATDVTTFGGNDGTATASPVGGTAPYIFVWSNAGTTATITGLTAGLYSVTVTDAATDSIVASVTVSEPTALVASAVVDSNVSFNGGNDGAATASATGGNPGYTYLWSDGQVSATASNLVAGVYTATVTDSTGGFDTATVTITEPTAVVASAVVDSNVTVNGGTDGAATASATGGNPGYTYLWSNAAATASLTGVSAGVYTVTVTDTTGGNGTAQVTITEPTAVVASAVVDNNVTVNGGTDGAATASATGGNPGYTYLWSNAATTASLTGVSAGVYTVTVTDTTGGNDTAQVTITEPTAVVASAVVDNNVTVNGGTDGAATASATGGNPGYTYLWSNAATTASITGLNAGVYTVTVTDTTGGNDTAQVTITEPTAVIASAVVDNNVTTNGGSDGQATASATGGTAPYTYVWSNGATTAVASGLVAGAYTVTVSDTNLDNDTASITITEPATVIASAVVDNDVSVNGGADGQATASASGGTAPYTYLWSNGATTATASGLTAGAYSVTVTDANLANDTANITITEPTAVLASITTTVNESSPGAADGSATVTASGGVPPYTYLWSNGATTATITGLSAGNYQVTVTDANGGSAAVSAVLVVLGSGVVTPVPVNSWWLLMILTVMMMMVFIKQQQKK